MDQKRILTLATLIICYNSTQPMSQDKETKNNKMLIRYTKNGVFFKVKELLQNKADITIKDKEGRSLPQLTSNQEILKLLKEYKEISDKSLINAVKSKNIIRVKNLLKSKNYNELSNNHGANALMYAAEDGLTEITNLLLKYEPTMLNEQDDSGLTALMIATQYKQEKIIDILLAHQANIYLKNREGESALNIAEKQLAMARRMNDFKKETIYNNIIDQFITHYGPITLRSKTIKVSEPESKSTEDEDFELITISECAQHVALEHHWVVI